jgi:glycosyltransferase involved in cell wall biosynthesis
MSIASRQLITRTSPRLQVEIIHNGVEIESFAPTPELQSQRSKRHPKIFICSGRLIERKGQQYLLQAADLLQNRGQRGNFKVVLVGTGDNEGQLRQQCNRLALLDTVQFAGFVDREAMPRYYAEADVFILPSYNEGMSIALLEALASGLPVVVTDTGGTAELVDNNGFIVPWADPVILADAMERFLKEPDLCQQMGAKSHAIAKAFTWQSTTQAYLELSSKCLSDSLDNLSDVCE